MKKLLCFLFLTVFFSQQLWSQYCVGTPVNDTLVWVSFSDNGLCYPQHTQHMSVSTGMFPYVTGLNMGFLVNTTVIPGYLSVPSDTIYSGDTLPLNGSVTGYDFYFASPGNVILYLIVWGTPTISGESYKCGPWSILLGTSTCQNSGIILYGLTCNVCPTTGMEEVINYEIECYPNPLSTQTTFQTNFPLTNATLTVDNIFGQTVAQVKNISGQTITFNRDNLPSGLYFVRLTEENKTIAVDKLVINDK